MNHPRQIASLAFPEVMSLDVTGPLQVFASANDELKRLGLPPAYQTLVLGPEAGPITTSAGFRLYADEAWSAIDAANLDTLLIPGGVGVDATWRSPDVLEWVRKAEGQVRRLGSVCSGALVLAAAGLLNDRVATTHWSRRDELKLRFPQVRVHTNRLHTYDPDDRDGNAHIFTSAGVTAGIDLALALVEADLGQALALAVARRLVVFLKRPGGQEQFSAYLMPEIGTTTRLSAVLDWIPDNLDKDLSLDVLAARIHMAPRTFSRIFVRDVGMTPGRYVERVRVEVARGMLQGGQVSASTAARLCGFGHPETLRRAFHRHLSVSPIEYAQRFSSSVLA
ncbi:GlxA family transcriptional regulator [Marinobacter fonticola]|uniref:GlxA family transcriptional regulator n=1 Tax=Marinobacter fonticola TaxID=2603215 RepID=UPI0011E6A332|nr:DJ-1/PfpI family protein [Marinobacter fonticola]